MPNLLEELSRLYPDSSKRTLKNWIKWGRVKTEGDKLSLAKKSNFVIYSDKWLIVINKPFGMLSVPDESGSYSALDRLKKQFPSVYPVHRLDYGASGTLLFARTPDMKRKLSTLFRNHDLEREYIAIVEGRVAQEKGTWSYPLHELESYDVVVSKEGREAITHFERLRVTPKFSTLRIQLETGRKHQIRVHCREVGHPIIGDFRYGAVSDPIKRLGLHAKSLSFIHPMTKKKMHFETEPKLGYLTTPATNQCHKNPSSPQE
ncbi:MAG: hypothetical protein S4CHLAM45_07050 [Chlamydiales bacterium]|nr:hypothetical protein [Chlamydiales bacterium]MCH9620277.1 hypothetical protein [Chlamydiales bacterium]MCH9622812.1 hypothetical protein [Chlamydiales bacterium]